MTVITKQAVNPTAHLTAGEHRAARSRPRRDPPEHPRRPRREGRGLHPQGRRRAAQARARLARGAAGQRLPAGVGARHRRPQRRQDPREHGDRAQRHARPVGLDARPEDPLDHLGVGQRLDRRGVEALAQRGAPHLHQHRRQGQRPRLRHHARRRGPALDAVLPRPAAVELRQRLLLRVRHRRLRPRARQEPVDPEGEAQRGVQAERPQHAGQDPQAGRPRTTSSTPRSASRPARSCRSWPPTSPPTWCATCGPTR